MPSLNFLVSVFFLSVSFCLKSQTAVEILESTLHKVNQLKGVHFEMVSTERINGQMSVSQTMVKTRFSPYQCYLQSILPSGEKGPEVLYKFGENNNQALISPNKFPYFNLNVSPYSWILRDGHHHTITENIFSFIAKVISHEMIKIGDEYINEYVSQKSDAIFRHWNCYQIEINWENFNWVPYTVKPGETFTSIAQNLVVSDYHILAKNTKYSGFDELLPGDRILVPNHYAKKVLFFIDKVTKLPVFTQIQDEQGIFSEYRINWLIVNPPFKDLDFSTEHPNYNF